MNELGYFVSRTRIAYFCMEIALRPEMHTYSGGLGILAGDTVRSCSDLGLPVVFVTLVSKQGYFRQEIDPEGRQLEHPDTWDPATWARPLPAMVGVDIEDRCVWIRPWLYIHAGPLGEQIPVLLLDTDLDQNAPQDRELTNCLYGGDEVYRLKQEVILGIGGVRILDALGFILHTYHLNEGHAALLTIELMRRFRRAGASPVGDQNGLVFASVRDLCIFTTHTPVDAGHDRFGYDLFQSIAGKIISVDDLRMFAGSDRLDMTRLALNLCGYVNGVARRHAETARVMFPGYDIQAITNGIHSETWVHPRFSELFETNFPRWWHDPEMLVRADQLSDDAIWSSHLAGKTDLCDLVRDTTGTIFDPELPIIGFARRMTGYKRPNLLFTDKERLLSIAARHPFQIVLAGKAHPRDVGGKEMIREIHRVSAELSDRIPIAFIPNYTMATAKALIAGADVWLNTPQPPLEASGTSGMKAALNGVLNLSTLDGWWIEGCIDGVTGWSIDAQGKSESDAEALYRKIEDVVLPLFYDDRARWIWMMKQAISKLASYFNSQRMMRRYASEAYIR
ncbi:MAG: alpha-glucan family phosphorylase [Planctomycetia bacterium]|nr:alpha-glucan family phosphorylase [Planctomycetia bacterium]